jgi:hypothetical protein
MSSASFLRCLCACLAIGVPTLLCAQEKVEQPPSAGTSAGWTSFVRGGAVYQPDTGLDDGGSYSATRYTIQLGSGYSWDRQSNVSLSVGYSCDRYDFSGAGGLGGGNPWENIHAVSFAVPMRKQIGANWTAFVIPSLRSSGESGAEFDETLTGSMLGGGSYRVSDRLTIGPGIGVFSQLEESTTVIPILIIDWAITDTWSLTTGRGLGATMGPGLTLNYRPSKAWSFGIGGRYEKLRFRLDKEGKVASGVGEDLSFPVYLSSTYSFAPRTNLSLVGGFAFGGELKLEDKDGETIKEDSYDAGIFFGLTFNKRF